MEGGVWIPLTLQVLDGKAFIYPKEPAAQGNECTVVLCPVWNCCSSSFPVLLAGMTQSCGMEANWAFMSCPPENECLNGHHDCNETQNCNDLPHGYKCTCKNGYTLDK